MKYKSEYQSKTYKYKGYKFRSTDIVHASTKRWLYEIDELKSAGKRPFLTTIAECKWYIDYMTEEGI